MFNTDISRRKNARERREYIHRKGMEHRLAQIAAHKRVIKDCISEDKALPGDVQKLADKLVDSSTWDDAGPELAGRMGTDAAGAQGLGDDIDDEYRNGGVEDPKIFLTTSHTPSSRLRMFAKEMKLIFPNTERMNRGNFDIKSLLASAKSNGYTDVIILHETRGRPDQMIVSHLPSGPTAYFTLYDVKLRHDIQDCGTMPEAYPNLVCMNFETKLGHRIKNILRFLFPVPKDGSKRGMVFINYNDYILFRHFDHKINEKGRPDKIREIGPQFTMLCHKIIRGTLEEEKAADVEYVLRPYMNTAHKTQKLSKRLPWTNDDETLNTDAPEEESTVRKDSDIGR